MKRIIYASLALIVLIVLYMLFMREEISNDNESVGFTLPLSGMVIVLDPGHGGVDGGAVSKSGLVESEVTLNISLLLRDFLQEAGAVVLMTREANNDLATDAGSIRGRKTEDLTKRAAFIKAADADLLVSVHANAIAEAQWRGAQTFYHLQVEESEVLAKSIQASLVYQLENTAREAKPIHHVYVLKHSAIPSALVEVGFLSNPEEAAELGTADYQQKVAASIYEGIMTYRMIEARKTDG
ncbi:N-acetylmuramoyl-L-alanine amidase CwlD [Paenalkalicoccus suaedae]|uniref:N-acetylmuramoyl-L-alanine amidase CwlD n=1 Tax=Paenalkalicoccus suaedae TaxID=2592382 RepID=A0A859F9N5_9BACI|nr:N-acetylmuramoyl-L-alanine amidase CwlD [Paenalkalicoccus suaedae]QKS69819.1 N-acetylmuramoyl-L-alanine amidase CwlD [Paenalkalicoccus suaedae]